MERIRLIKASDEDTILLHRLQREAFMSLYERFHDDTNPSMETVERVACKIAESDFFVIYLDDIPVGGVRVRLSEDDGVRIRNISPIFILPSYCDKGIGSAVMEKLFGMYADTDKWSLATIQQDKRNCHFYEKLGFVPTGSTTVIKDGMTIIGFEKEMHL